MRSNDDTKNRTNIANNFDNNKREDIEDWNNEHGNPSNDFLQSLAEDNNLEKLRSIASDLDVDFGPGDSAEELVGKINSTAQNDDPNTTT